MNEEKVVNGKGLNIHQKMLQATMNIERVKKGLTVEMGKDKNGNVRSYKAVKEGDVLSAVKPIEIELGIYSYPISRIIIESAVLVDAYEKKSQFLRVETTYRFVNIDNPTDFIDMTTYGDGIDNGDKAPGKAMTYADKYALLKAYKIETGDDPDQEGSKEYKSIEKTDRRAEELSYSNTKKCTEAQATAIALMATGDRLKALLEHYGAPLVSDLTELQAHDAIEILKKKK